MKRALTILALLTLLASGMSPSLVTRMPVNTDPPAEPVRLIFIHHSTGGNWLADPSQNELGGGLGQALMDNNYYVSATNYGWGPESIGDATDIPNWLDWFTGERSPVYLEALYNEDGQNFGDFGSWPRLSADPGGENTIIVFKSCFPNSELEGRSEDAPTAEGWLTVGHAKYVYNELLKYFMTQPDKLFVVVTAPPLSNTANAKNARAFNDWLVYDWLDLYPLSNVAVFDLYNVLTGKANHHRVVDGYIDHTYTEGQNRLAYPSADDHPSREGNTKATTEFLPMLNAFYNTWQESPRLYGPTDIAPGLATSAPEADALPTETPSAGALPAGSSPYSEDFEDSAPGWEAFTDDTGGTTLMCTVGREGAYGGGSSLRMIFDVAQDGWATCGITFDSPQDWSSSQSLSMMINPTGTIYHVDVYAGTPEDRQTYYFPLDAPGDGSGWTTLRLSWDSFKRVEWEENAGQPLTNTDQILGIAFGVPSAGQGTLWVDDIQLMGSMPVGSAETEAPEPLATEAEPSTPVKKGLCSNAFALPLMVVVVSWWGRRKNRSGNNSRRVE